MARTISIQRSLITSVVAIVVLLGLAIVAMSYLGNRRTLRRFSGSLTDQTLHRIEVHLEGLFVPVERELRSLRTWCEAGLLDIEDAEALNRLLEPVVREDPGVSSVMVADELGREHMLLFHDGTWRNRRTRRDEWGDQVRWLEWSGEPADAERREESVDYDPRTRPWFAGAAAGEAAAAGDPAAASAPVHWTEPYAFFTTGEPGMTASTAFRGSDGLLRVVGLDLRLTDISVFTSRLRVHDHGFAFVLSDDGRLVGLPHDPDDEEGSRLAEELLKYPRDLGTPLAREVSQALLERDDRVGVATRFVSAGQAWWGQVQPFPLGADRGLLIGVVVPESDLIGDLSRQRIWIGLITLAVLGLAVGRAVALASRYSRPVGLLVEESRRIATGDLEPGPPIETRVEEVHRLAEAHDKMRDGLRTLLKIERELQLARKIQQGTFPAQLPRLAGYEIGAWSEPADHTGGDTYDVIGLRGATPGGRLQLTDEDAERAVLLLADATGHGIGPALSVTQVRAMLRMALRISDDLSDIATQMNQQLCADLPPARFITVWLGALNAADHELITLSGGQAPLLHYRAAEDEFDVLKADTTPFGMFDHGAIEISTRLKLGRGDIYAAISDGIFEAANSTGDEFGLDRTREIIRRHRGETAPEILDRIREACDAFTAGAPAADDQTIILIKRV